jgi:acetylornithine deacetylase/succinyl-diaminopimelate desuccinylase-like protein
MTLSNTLLDLALQIQQIPAPTFAEDARARFVLKKFHAEGLADPSLDSAGNVWARLPGGSAAPLIVSAHLDTVFPPETNLAVRRETGRIYAPGLGDNSLGVAALFGLLWQLREQKHHLPGDLWLVANTCEEGLGDLRGMKAVCQRFGPAVRAYLVLEGMAYGHVYHHGIGVRRYKISLHTRGGHSWIDFGQPSAIHELAQLVSALATLQTPMEPRTTYNVGRIGGGTSINTVAPEAWLELDLRSESAEVLETLARKVESLVETRNQRGVRAEMQVIGQRPAGEIAPSHPLIQLARSILSSQGVDPMLTSGSTDANFPLSLGYPALVLGLTHGGGAHSAEEFIETAPLQAGLWQLVEFVRRAWD